MSVLLVAITVLLYDSYKGLQSSTLVQYYVP